MATKIHSSAQIEDGVQLGTDVQVGPNCIIYSGAVIGNRCRLDAGVVVYGSARLGENVHLHAYCVIGDTPQDMAFEPDTLSYAQIDDACVLREHVTVHRGTTPDSTTHIEAGCFLMANSHVAHNVTMGRQAILANGVLLAGYVHIGEQAFISGNAVVHQFCQVGRLAMVSGLGAVSQDLPPFCIQHSTETNKVSGINIVGLRRAGMTVEERTDIRRAFRMLYMAGLNTRAAAEGILESFPTGPARELALFIQASKRGICSYRGKRHQQG